jgi:hypothetical protein
VKNCQRLLGGMDFRVKCNIELVMHNLLGLVEYWKMKVERETVKLIGMSSGHSWI